MNEKPSYTNQLIINQELTSAPNSKRSSSYFNPKDDSGRDKFGNIMFFSPELGYSFKPSSLERSGVLISPTGKELMKCHPGFFKNIEEGITRSIWSQDNSFTWEKNNFRMERLGEDSYHSIVHIISIGELKLVLKNHGNNHRLKLYEPEIQPYIREMIQTQEISSDPEIEKLFMENSLSLSTFLFASPFVSVTKHVHGSYLSKEEVEILKSNVGTQLREFIDRAESANPKLWSQVELDFWSEGAFRPPTNFIKRESDKRIVWIDPFYIAGPRITV